MQKIEFFDRHSASELQGLLSVELDTMRSFIFRLRFFQWAGCGGQTGLSGRSGGNGKRRRRPRPAGFPSSSPLPPSPHAPPQNQQLLPRPRAARLPGGLRRGVRAVLAVMAARARGVDRDPRHRTRGGALPQAHAPRGAGAGPRAAAHGRGRTPGVREHAHRALLRRRGPRARALPGAGGGELLRRPRVRPRQGKLRGDQPRRHPCEPADALLVGRLPRVPGPHAHQRADQRHRLYLFSDVRDAGRG
jgi:hypothetical protein